MEIVNYKVANAYNIFGYRDDTLYVYNDDGQLVSYLVAEEGDVKAPYYTQIWEWSSDRGLRININHDDKKREVIASTADGMLNFSGDTIEEALRKMFEHLVTYEYSKLQRTLLSSC
jgi:hypothetical protein